jgi:hypothetical protein
VQADRHAGVARHPGDQVDVVLAGEQIDVGACMPMRHRDRATANGRIHARDLGQLAERTAHDQPLFIGHTRIGDVVDDDLGGLTEKFELRVEPAQLPPWHEHQRSRLPQRLPVVDEQAGSGRAGRPTARSAGSTHGEVFRYMERGLTVKQIASGRGSGVSYIRDVWNSLLHSRKGTMPDSKSDAKINSQVYKELLNHYLSPALRTYVNTRLDKLIEINPEINMDPLRTRTHQHSVNRRTGRHGRPSARRAG